MIIHNNQLFLINSRKSVTTAEKYAEFSLRQLEANFTSLVNSTKNNEILEMGNRIVVNTYTSKPVNPISGFSTS